MSKDSSGVEHNSFTFKLILASIKLSGVVLMRSPTTIRIDMAKLETIIN